MENMHVCVADTCVFMLVFFYIHNVCLNNIRRFLKGGGEASW